MSFRLGRLTALALIPGVLGGCYAGSGGVASDPAPASLSVAETPSGDSECGGIVQSNDAVDPTLENLRPIAKDVVIGVVKETGSPFWDSPIGMPPSPSDRPGPGNEFAILTPYVVTVDQTLAGSRGPGEVTVVVEGGTIGCYFHTVEPAVEIRLGQHLVLFLREKAAWDGVRAIEFPMAFRTMPVQADGTVLTPMDGPKSIEALASGLSLEVSIPTR